jgi:hypothetical protein
MDRGAMAEREGGGGEKYAYLATKIKRNSKVWPGILCLLVVSASILRGCRYELLQYKRYLPQITATEAYLASKEF